MSELIIVQRPEVRCEEVLGGNFSPARDAEGVARWHFDFLDGL